MATGFADFAGSANVTMADPSQWTIDTADLPNGDNAAHCAATTAKTSYTDASQLFDLPFGSGTVDVTIEFWIKVTAATNHRIVCSVAKPAPVAATDIHYNVFLLNTEEVRVEAYNTGGGVYLSRKTGILTAGWHHIVAVINCGTTKNITMYADMAINHGSVLSGPTATPVAAASTWHWTIAAGGDSTQVGTDHLAKLAYYTRALTLREIALHYYTMVVT